MIARHFRRPRLIAFFIAGLISFFDLAGFWKIELLPLFDCRRWLDCFFLRWVDFDLAGFRKIDLLPLFDFRGGVTREEVPSSNCRARNLDNSVKSQSHRRYASCSLPFCITNFACISSAESICLNQKRQFPKPIKRPSLQQTLARCSARRFGTRGHDCLPSFREGSWRTPDLMRTADALQGIAPK